MEFTDLIHKRESVRDYDPERPVPREIIEKILDAGRLAPSACNNQPWKFLVISSSDMLDKIKSCYKRDWFKEAPHIIVATGFKNQAWNRSYDGYNSVETDVAIAMTHLILAAENEGVGTCWIAAYDPSMLKKVLDIDKNQQVFAITPLGYPKPGFKKSSGKKRKSPEQIIEFL